MVIVMISESNSIGTKSINHEIKSEVFLFPPNLYFFFNFKQFRLFFTS